MCSSLVYCSNKETNTEWSLGWVSSLDLTLPTNSSNQPFAWMSTAIDIRVVEACVAHEFGQETSISCHSRNANAHVIIDSKHFFLVIGQIVRTLLQTHQNLKLHKMLRYNSLVKDMLTNFSKFTYDMGV